MGAMESASTPLLNAYPMAYNNLIYLLDNQLFYTAGKETNRKKVILTVEEIEDVLHHYHSDAMGGHSGVNATLQNFRSLSLEWYNRSF